MPETPAPTDHTSPKSLPPVGILSRGRSPFHGYYYKVFTRQGPNAPGGAKNYFVNGKMTKGFAFLAYPAKYRASGVVTFEVNQDGVIVQKDLGPNTVQLANAISEFNPDQIWDQDIVRGEPLEGGD
jgi:Protein of unknown function (DUF2950)